MLRFFDSWPVTATLYAAIGATVAFLMLAAGEML